MYLTVFVGRRICIPVLYSFFQLLLTVPNCYITVLDFCRYLYVLNKEPLLCMTTKFYNLQGCGIPDWVDDDVPSLHLFYKEWIVHGMRPWLKMVLSGS